MSSSPETESGRASSQPSAQPPAESLEETAQRRRQAERAASDANAFLDYRRRAVASFEKTHGLRVQAGTALDDATVAVPSALNEAVARALEGAHEARTSGLEARKTKIGEALRAVGSSE